MINISIFIFLDWKWASKWGHWCFSHCSSSLCQHTLTKEWNLLVNFNQSSNSKWMHFCLSMAIHKSINNPKKAVTNDSFSLNFFQSLTLADRRMQLQVHRHHHLRRRLHHLHLHRTPTIYHRDLFDLPQELFTFINHFCCISNQMENFYK